MSLESQFDDLLVNMTSQIGKGCPGLLDQMFGFLHRRTDFFYEMEPEDKMGFPPGIAEQMVFQHFKKYQDMHFKKFPQKPDLVKRWEEYNKKQKELSQAKKAQEIEKGEMPPKVQEIIEEAKSSNPGKSNEPPPLTAEQKAKIMNEINRQELQKEGIIPPDPPKPVEIPQEMKDISTYNGDVTEKYKWSQELNEVIVQVDLPEGSNSKSVSVNMQTKNLKIVLKSTGEEIINGELFGKIIADESYWSIEDGNKLILTLNKAQEMIWKTIIVGDQEIDPKTVDNSKRIDQFDVETQGHLQKVLYEQNRKLNGLPTTEEMEQQKLMEKVFNAENSPFKNQPYEPQKYGEGPQIPFKH